MASDVQNARFKDLDIFYDFAERCNDDYDIMSQVISKHIRKSEAKIKQSLEYTRINKFLDIMKCCSSQEIDAARLEIKNKKIKLFNFGE